MIDVSKLKAQYRLAVVSCLGVTAIPFLLAFVAYTLATSSDPGSAGSGTADPVILVVFALMAFSPLISGPMIRRAAKVSIVAEKQPSAGVESTIMSWAVSEYAIWEISSLLGFVGFVQGAPPVFLIACIVVTFVGFAFSFPRWSRWVALAQELRLVTSPNALI